MPLAAVAASRAPEGHAVPEGLKEGRDPKVEQPMTVTIETLLVAQKICSVRVGFDCPRIRHAGEQSYR